ncbi:DNA adenine methylase [Ureaplasma sp. ES3154-GEN]|uniref:DNA adenine methylase n=1 Tax=Ureaplasma sp. ES3154-GEN TaxID=2984844 RepID=UPI0021E82FD1|nr:DNA adenine methylase [Ureaplasma sp. ES3154-GEN]MCV3743845.1 DNA adenine methylase [Ureaplasma sp. ES3154-GEN]
MGAIKNNAVLEKSIKVPISKNTSFNISIDVKPFIKWAGGKSALLQDIRKFYPSTLGKKIDKYCEPFVGAGAVLFDVLSNYDLDKIYISDVNNELINVYKSIKSDVEKLVNILKKIQNEYIYLDTEKRKEYYYAKRDEFNKYIRKETDDIIYGSALFIFLNKTCFNGLYRVNSKGLFNVPIGSYKNPKICDEANLKNISLKLRNVNIHYAEYDKSIDFIDENTLVYFDPPYRPLTETASFTSYDKSVFGDKEQIELAEYYKKVSAKGAVCILSNSDPRNTDEEDNFFDDLYKGFHINRIQSKRRINSNASKRGNVNELLITNFFKDGE